MHRFYQEESWVGFWELIAELKSEKKKKIYDDDTVSRKWGMGEGKGRWHGSIKKGRGRKDREEKDQDTISRKWGLRKGKRRRWHQSINQSEGDDIAL